MEESLNFSLFEPFLQYNKEEIAKNGLELTITEEKIRDRIDLEIEKMVIFG